MCVELRILVFLFFFFFFFAVFPEVLLTTRVGSTPGPVLGPLADYHRVQGVVYWVARISRVCNMYVSSSLSSLFFPDIVLRCAPWYLVCYRDCVERDVFRSLLSVHHCILLYTCCTSASGWRRHGSSINMTRGYSSLDFLLNAHLRFELRRGTGT